MMINWEEIDSQEFIEEQRLELDFEKGKKFITLTKIPFHIRNKIQANGLLGRESELTYNETGALSKEVVKFTKEYAEAKENQFRLLIEYGIDKKKHDLGTGELTVKDFEELALRKPGMVEMIKLEIMYFNGLLERPQKKN